MELSYSFGCLPDDEIGTMLEMHPQDCILFGIRAMTCLLLDHLRMDEKTD